MPVELILEALDARLAFAAVVIIVAAIIAGYTGFGGALFQMPFMFALFGPVEAVAITRLVGLVGRAQLYPNAAATANWKEVFPLAIAIAVVTPCFARKPCSRSIDSGTMVSGCQAPIVM